MMPWETPIREDDGIPPDFVRDASNIAPWQRDVRSKRATVKCTLCAAVESPMFYTGCLVKDGHAPDWDCDGRGNLTRRPEFPWCFVCSVCGDGGATDDGCRLCGAGPAG